MKKPKLPKGFTYFEAGVMIYILHESGFILKFIGKNNYQWQGNLTVTEGGTNETWVTFSSLEQAVPTMLAKWRMGLRPQQKKE